jgi:hypothetical protein
VGDLEYMALFAGQVAGAIDTTPRADARGDEIVSAACATIERLRAVIL